eukprot:Hpha_TRINITY_DN30083_c0_g1::TRINITY_DN30083_c0_g1_i1::g.21621::m.21621
MSVAGGCPLRVLASKRPSPIAGRQLRSSPNWSRQRRWGGHGKGQLAPYMFDKVDDFTYPLVPRADLFKGHAVPGEKPPPFSDRIPSGMPVRLRDSDFAMHRREYPRVITQFAEMGISPHMTAALSEEFGVTLPSPVQQLGMPLAMKQRTVIMHAATGTGKTLACLVPAVELLRRRINAGFTPRANRPQIVIMAPTRELIHQHYMVAQRLASRLGLSVRKNMRRTMDKPRKHDKRPYHILVTSALEYRHARDKGQVVDSDLMTVIIDEADTMIGGSPNRFKREFDQELLVDFIRPILEKQFDRDSYLGRYKCQFLFTCAVATEHMSEFIKQWIPHAHVAATQDAHRAPPSLDHRFWWVRQTAERMDNVKSLLRGCGHIPDKDAHDRTRRRERDDFWFPDAISFEPPPHSPLLPGSWRVKRHGTRDERHMGFDQKRKDYLDDYSRLNNLKLALQDGRAYPLLTVGSSAADSESNALVTVGEDGIIESASSPSAATSLVPALAGKVLKVPLEDEVTPMRWGATRITPAPFYGIPRTPQYDPPGGLRVIVFCNKKENVKMLSATLADAGFKVAMFSQDGGAQSATAARVNQFEKWATGEVNILVATDIAARGLDYQVDTVINYDLPMTPGDYLHRVGRAGRFGRRGMVHNLVIKPYRNERVYAQRLEHMIAKQYPLANIAIDAEALRVDIRQWWDKKKIRADREMDKLRFRGFGTKFEEQRSLARTVRKTKRTMVDPNRPLGIPKGALFPFAKIMQQWWQMSWQNHHSTSGTGNYLAKRAGTSKLLAAENKRFKIGYGSGGKDFRASNFLKPATRQKKYARIAKLGGLGHFGRPLKEGGLYRHEAGSFGIASSTLTGYS